MTLRKEEDIKKIKDEFALIINCGDADNKLITIIDKLSLIPDAESPIRDLAKNNGNIVEKFIETAKQRAIQDAEKAFQEGCKRFLEEGGRSQFYPSSPNYFPAIFLKLITPIYKGAIYGYANAGNINKVNALLSDYVRWLKRDMAPLEKSAKIIKMHELAINGYYQGDHFEEIAAIWKENKNIFTKITEFSALYIVAYSLAILGKSDDVSEFLASWSAFTGNPKHAKIIEFVRKGYEKAELTFEIERLNATKEIIQTVQNESSVEVRQNKILELIAAIENKKLKESLLIDCIYQGTVLGKELWQELDSLFAATPSLKRGSLAKVVYMLVEMDVDIAALPGCEAYKKSNIGKWLGSDVGTTFPSKKTLVGMFPHSPHKKPGANVKEEVLATPKKETEDPADESDEEAHFIRNAELGMKILKASRNKQ